MNSNNMATTRPQASHILAGSACSTRGTPSPSSCLSALSTDEMLRGETVPQTEATAIQRVSRLIPLLWLVCDIFSLCMGIREGQPQLGKKV